LKSVADLLVRLSPPLFYTRRALNLEDDYMQAVLKSLHSTDIGDVEKYCLTPDEEDQLGFTLRAMPARWRGKEKNPDIVVCTPKWLLEKYTDSDVLLGLHKLIVFKCDHLRLRKFIEIPHAMLG
jgi:hypothetical protein